MRSICLRLRRGDDLLLSIRQLAQREGLRCAVVLSGVGCVTEARVRDASGVTVRHIAEPCEIVSLNGTVSAARCHLHIALSREDLTTLGGLPTPRAPSEQREGRVVSARGADVTAQYQRGAEEALHMAALYGCTTAVLKERSPSCGSGRIYDGTFSGTLTEGWGTAAALLRANGIRVLGESNLERLLRELDGAQ